MDLSKQQGTQLVKYIRKTLEEYYREKEPDIKQYVSEDMNELISRGAAIYVTLLKYPSLSFRGSAGHILPIISLGEAVRELTLKAAFRDTRFIPLMKSELRDTVVEFSILKRPVYLKAKSFADYPGQIKIGRDGIAIEKEYTRVMLLPQVAMRRRWNSKQFLSFALLKGKINPMIKQDRIRVYTFQAQVFREEKPGGNIIEEEFS